MCGRFSQTKTAAELEAVFALTAAPALVPRYNIAPGQSVPVIRQGRDGRRELVELAWGLVPHFSRDRKSGYKNINARAETVRDKPSFRDAVVRRRCVVVGDGFYEWHHPEGQKRGTPHFIRRKDGAPLAMAGLWERWHDEKGEVLETCAIITRDADAVVRPLHDRMPVILDASQLDVWLSPVTTMPEVEGLLAATPPPLETYRVSSHVNSPAHDDPKCLEADTRPAPPEQLSLGGLKGPGRSG